MGRKTLVNLELTRNQQNLINTGATAVTMFVTVCIGFFLSPYIVAKLGAEANAFVALANNFISYAMIARQALDSMGSRFIMIAYYNGEIEKARKYYSSLFIGDLVLAGVFLILGFLCILKLELIIDISDNLVYDVKMLFSLLFANFVISTAVTVWSIAPYVVNKLYLSSIRTAQASLIRAVVIVLMFSVFNVKVYFIAVGTLIAGLINYCYDFHYKKKLLKEFRIRKEDFSKEAIKELLSSGIWNSVSSLGATFTNGLDLLITNLFVGATPMGVLSIAKTMPGFINTLNEQIATVFTPSMIIDYAKDDKIAIVKTIKQSSRIISVICTIPLAFLVVYGSEFYSLWQPTQDAKVLQTLSIITIAGRFLFSGMQPLFNIFTVVNKVKQNSIVMLVTGVITMVVTFILVKFTSLGVYAVVSVSVIGCAIKNLVFVIPFSAKYLGIKKSSFFYTILPSVGCTLILCGIGFVFKIVFKCNTWISMILVAGLFAIVGFEVSSLVVLNKEERKLLFEKLLKVIKR